MFIKRIILCVLISYNFISVLAQSESDGPEWDRYLYEAEDEDIESLQREYEHLSEIAEHPLNINTITKEELEQFPFLSDKTIENILYYLYKGPMLSANSLLGVEGMSLRERKLLQKFIYFGKAENKRDELKLKNILRYNKQELLTRFDIPLNVKAGYADYDRETLEKSPNKKYYGAPFYHNLRYRFSYRNQLFLGFTAEKDAGEPFFSSFNKKGYDFYSAYFFLKDFKRLKSLAVGNYRVNFGYGLVINSGSFRVTKSNTWFNLNRPGRGLNKYTSTKESDYLQGVGATYKLADRWDLSAFYSFRKMDARVEDVFIRSLKTDGYHRLKKDLEKKNTVSNHLAGSNLSYNGRSVKWGLTAVYNVFDKVLNPDERPYNRYYPRGRYFYNVGVFYKFFLHKFIIAGEAAIDKNGKAAVLNTLTYLPTVNTTFLLINRYYDKRYQGLYAGSFSENSRIQNEAGVYISMENRLLYNLSLLCYGDFFHFPYRRFQVDRDNTSGWEGGIQLSYAQYNPLSVFIKYSYKNRAKNYASGEGRKLVLPYIRQRLHYQLSYKLNEQVVFKTVAEYIHAAYWQEKSSGGGLCGMTAKVGFPDFPVQAAFSGAWFKTDDYDSRVYFYEPNVLYAFSMSSLYGRGTRVAVNLRYDVKERLACQFKWGWTHYRDRDRIGYGTEEIQGSDKADLVLQLRMKW